MQHSFRSLAAGAVAGLVTAGLLAAPAFAATAATSAASGRVAGRLPLSARQMLADRQAHLSAALPRVPGPGPRVGTVTGSVTGVAQAPDGQPLAGVCVAAYGPSGERVGVTSATGRFFIGGLRLGSYRIRYQGCDSATAGYLAQWYGAAQSFSAATGRAEARTVLISRSGVQALAPVTLRTPAESSPARDVIDVSSPAAAARSLAVALGLPVAGSAAFRSPGREVTVGAQGGRIAGRVTEPNGKPLRGICVEAVSDVTLAFATGRTGANGTYRTGRVPAGSYTMLFATGCGNNGNWVMQERSKPVTVKAGKTTTGVNAVLQLGGEITGTITDTAGHKLSDVCVEPIPTRYLSGGNVGVFAIAGPGGSFHGAYQLRGVAPGSYKVLFVPCSQTPSQYAPEWWDNTASQRAAKVLRVRSGRVDSNVNAVMPTGAVITGTVTDASAAPLPGICVDAVPTGTPTLLQEIALGATATTGAAGQYELEGLPAGSYQVYFNTGCGNNGDYVSAASATVSAALGQTYSGVNAVLQAGASIAGTVTTASSSPLAGICVFVYGGPQSYVGGSATTATDGTYLINNEVPTGTYYVAFSGGCGNTGSYGEVGYNSPNPNAPQPITITTAGQAVTGIDAAMNAGASISGTVTTSKGQKLTGLCAGAFAAGDEVGLAETHSGQYTISNLQPGEYQVGFGPGCGTAKENQEEQNLVTAVFGSQANPPYVSAPAGSTTGINGVLQTAGAISGSARTKSGKSTLSCVLLTGVSGAAKAAQSFSQIYADGSYKDTGLLPGKYTVAFVPSCALPSPYEAQWYKDKPSPAGATPVKVVAGRTTSGITSALVKGGSISGVITSNGKPVSGMCVFAQNISQFYEFGETETNSTGQYVIEGLNSGRYELELDPCGPGSADLAAALLPTLVSVTAPHTARANATAQLGGGISGQLIGDTPAVAQPGICVDAVEANAGIVAAAVTEQDGTFEITNLPAGQYYIYFNDSTCTDVLANVVSQWYPDAATERAATPVTVTAGAVYALPVVTLPTQGGISGTVSAGSSSTPVPGACVIATSSIAGSAPVYAVSGSSGAYSIVGLQPGTYTVEFTSGCGASGYKPQWWDDKSSAESATPVPVSAAATSVGISATLVK